MKTLKIALFGHRLDSGNLGVDALTQAHLSMIGQLANELLVEIEADVFAGSEESVKEMPSLHDRLRLRQLPNPIMPKRIFHNCWKFPRELRKYDLIFDLSEGDSFSDIYGWRRAYVHTLQKIFATASGRPLVISPMTVGPFVSPVWRYLGGVGLRRAALVVARDVKSADVARSLGRADVLLTTDLAMALPYTRVAHGLLEENFIRVGLNVSGLLWGGGYSGKNEFGLAADYRQLTEAMGLHILSKPKTVLYLVPHVLSADAAAEDDRAACLSLQKRLPACRLAPSFMDSIEAKSYIAGLDFFIGARMHACIAAFSSGVPVLPLAYSMKFQALFGSLGYHRTVDLRDHDENAAMAKLEEGLSHRAELAEEVDTANSKAQSLLDRYRNHLRSQMEGGLS